MKQLKKDHDEVKKESKNLTKEFGSLRDKMADKSDRASSPRSADVQHLTDTCDGFSTTIESFQTRLNKLATQVEAVTKAIDDATSYSYQHNLKIVGVPQTNEKETAEETTSLCLKIFKKIGVDVRETDIDIAHRIPTRKQNGRRGQRNNAIVCKFVRRMVRERVLAARANTNRLTSNDFDLPSGSQIDRIGILSHLSPKLQDLLRSAKPHQTEHGHKICWAKSTAVFLRKSDNSRIFRIESEKDLEDLRRNESTNDESHS